MRIRPYLGELSLGASALGVAALVLTASTVLTDSYAVDASSSSPPLAPSVLSSVVAGSDLPSGSIPPVTDRTETTTTSQATTTSTSDSIASTTVPSKSATSKTTSNSSRPNPPEDATTRTSELPTGWVRYEDPGSFTTVLPKKPTIQEDVGDNGELRREAFVAGELGESYSVTSIEVSVTDNEDAQLRESAEHLAAQVSGTVNKLELDTVGGVRRSTFEIGYPAGVVLVTTYIDSGEFAIFIMLPPRNATPSAPMMANFDAMVEGYRSLR